MARRLFVSVSMFTRLPTGSSSCHRSLTPIAAAAGPAAALWHLLQIHVSKDRRSTSASQGPLLLALASAGAPTGWPGGGG